MLACLASFSKITISPTNIAHPLLGSLGDVGLGSVGVSAESNIPLPYMLLHTVCIHGTQGQVRDTTAYTMVHRELRGLHIAVPVAVLIATAI